MKNTQYESIAIASFVRFSKDIFLGIHCRLAKLIKCKIISTHFFVYFSF